MPKCATCGETLTRVKDNTGRVGWFGDSAVCESVDGFHRPVPRKLNIHGQPIEPCYDDECPHDFCYFDEHPDTDCGLTEPHTDCVSKDER